MAVADTTHKEMEGKEKSLLMTECLLVSVEGMTVLKKKITPAARWPIEVAVISGCSRWPIEVAVISGCSRWREDLLRNRVLAPSCSILSQILISYKWQTGDQVTRADTASGGTGRHGVSPDKTC